MILTPEIKEIDCFGKVSYDEKTRAWTILKFKKEVVMLFPILKERRNKIQYNLKAFLSLQSFQEFSEKVNKKELGVPIVLYLERRENEEKSLHPD